jgi:regulator of protease activity HflC (stomatin/prohibitin superfamily)
MDKNNQIFGDSFGNVHSLKKWALFGAGGIAGLIFLSGCWTTVPPGTIGVPVTFGQVGSESWNPGFHFKLPFVTSVVEMPTRLLKHAVDAPAASRDLQAVTAQVTVPFSLLPPAGPQVYQVLGSVEALQASIIDPGVMESVKAVTALFTAEELVTEREAVKGKIEDQVRSYVRQALAQKRLPGAIEIGEVAITHFDFSPEFNTSIEQKVKAEQDALRAENEKKQKVTQAEAERDSTKAVADGEAYSIEVRSKAEAAAIQRKADALRANANLVELNAVDKWDGKLPVYVTGGAPLPFISVGKP